MRGFQRLVGNQHDSNSVSLLDGANRLALFVKQKGSDFDRQLNHNPTGLVLHRLFLD